ncbi:hypothetical protein WP12_05275 [Sphingomonas sp. SRS2]|nr:DEAD/DEAH box helicase family protein [Sphingomonas sp. SRS2]KKC27093.1 hypothetical protein WP12_05275 [Sphingomonas sp. SRS2]
MKLFNARWNLTDWKAAGEPTRHPRILFLADRNILADQAYNSFAAFDDGALARITPGDIRKKGAVPKNASVFFTIFQTFTSGTDTNGDPAPYFGDYPPDFFDCIIIDECHRGGAKDESEWRAILDYFAPAVQIGLTATPKRKNNADTYAYFGQPVYTYSLKEGINDGYLTPFKVRQIGTTIDEYVYTSDDAVIEGEVEDGTRRDAILSRYDEKQRDFLDFVLSQYATVGESELDDGKLPALLELKYGTPMDAVRELGSVAEIRSTFLGFQRGLYEGESN